MSIDVTPQNYYTKEVQKVYKTNSQVNLFRNCQWMWWRTTQACNYERNQDLSQFLRGHLFEKLLMRPDQYGDFADAHPALFTTPTIKEIREILMGQSKNVITAVKSSFPDTVLTRGKTAGEFKASFTITDEMKEAFPAIFKPRGELKSKYAVVHEMIDSVNRHEEARELIRGAEHDIPIVGEIDGIPVMGLLDMIAKTGEIVDLKHSSYMDELKWSDDLGKKVPFYELWNYWQQLAFYQGIEGNERKLRIICTDVPTETTRFSKTRIYRFDNRNRLSWERSHSRLTINQMNVTTEATAIHCQKCACCREDDKNAPAEIAIDYRQVI